MNRTQRDLVLLAAGIGIGVGLGMLLAPRSGRETREVLQRTATQAVDRGRDYWQRIRSSGGNSEVVDVVEAQD
ncbi:MAG: YtxH domain-containing protein [Dehalococcoidia bacterium]|nr:YtxH domain-containing protein [Dehalococcoidia bacterium]